MLATALGQWISKSEVIFFGGGGGRAQGGVRPRVGWGGARGGLGLGWGGVGPGVGIGVGGARGWGWAGLGPGWGGVGVGWGPRWGWGWIGVGPGSGLLASRSVWIGCLVRNQRSVNLKTMVSLDRVVG